MHLSIYLEKKGIFHVLKFYFFYQNFMNKLHVHLKKVNVVCVILQNARYFKFMEINVINILESFK